MHSHSTKTQAIVDGAALKTLIANEPSSQVTYRDDTLPSIFIELNDLPESCKGILQTIFSYMLQNPHMPLLMEAVYTCKGEPNNRYILSAKTLTDFSYLASYYFFIRNPIILSALYSALQQANIELNVTVIIERIAKTALLADKHDFSESVMLLYGIARKQPMPVDLQSAFAQQIILTGCLNELIRRYGKEEIAACMTSVIQTKKDLLHTALSTEYIEPSEINQLIEILQPGTSPLNLYTSGQSSLLHVCKHPEYLSFALKHTADVNATTRLGFTPLDVALREDDAEKSWFLLRNGAQWKNEGDRPHLKSIPRSSMFAFTPLTLFKQFRETGVALSSPPESMEQRGKYCGLNSAASAIQFFQRTSSALKTKPYCPARKSDVLPPADTSIRHIAKRVLNMTKIGEMYSATQLGDVLKHAGCQYDLVDVTDYAQFMRLIKTALQLDLPVLIPHVIPCALPDNKIERREHWTAIIGWRTNNGIDLLLTAENGGYYADTATSLYERNTQMEECSKGGTYVKWNGKFLRKDSIDGDAIPVKEVEIPPANLADFRGKLLITMPPEFDIEKWHAAKNVDPHETRDVNVLESSPDHASPIRGF